MWCSNKEGNYVDVCSEKGKSLVLPALAYLSSIRGGCPSPTARNEATIFSFFARSRQTGAVSAAPLPAAPLPALRCASFCHRRHSASAPPLCLAWLLATVSWSRGNFHRPLIPECRGTAAVFDVDRAQKRNFGLGDHRRQPESQSESKPGGKRALRARRHSERSEFSMGFAGSVAWQGQAAAAVGKGSSRQRGRVL